MILGGVLDGVLTRCRGIAGIPHRYSRHTSYGGKGVWIAILAITRDIIKQDHTTVGGSRIRWGTDKQTSDLPTVVRWGYPMGTLLDGVQVWTGVGIGGGVREGVLE